VRGYFEQAGLKDVVDYRIGNALNFLPSINETIDLVFIDADKENYAEVLQPGF
jgi:caffeoyl-CoA O-methyltransferase